MITLSKFLPLLLTTHPKDLSIFLLTKKTRIELKKSDIDNFYDSMFVEKLFYNIDVLNIQIDLKFNGIYLKNNKEKSNNYVLSLLELRSYEGRVYVKNAVVLLSGYNTFYKETISNIPKIQKGTNITFFCIEEEIDKINNHNKRKLIFAKFRDNIQSHDNPVIQGFYDVSDTYNNHMNYNFYYMSSLFNGQICFYHYFEFNLLNFKEKINEVGGNLIAANRLLDKKLFGKYRKILKSRKYKPLITVGNPTNNIMTVDEYLKLEFIFKVIETSNNEESELKKLYELLKNGVRNYRYNNYELSTTIYSELFIIFITFKELQLKIMCNDDSKNLEFLNLIYSENLVNQLEKNILLGDIE